MFNHLQSPASFSKTNFHGRSSIVVDSKTAVRTLPRLSFAGLFGWIRRRRTAALRLEADALELVTRFGGQAYYQAEQLSKGYGLDGSGRSRLHWARVKIEIARRHPIDTGLSGSLQWD